MPDGRNVVPMTTTTAQWAYEFSEDYAVPAQAIEAAGLVDQSWHNDACPSFALEMVDPITSDVHDLRLWVEHPDVDMRDSGFEHRFAICYQPWSSEPVEGVTITDYGTLYHGDDLEEALRVYRETVEKIQSALAARALTKENA